MAKNNKMNFSYDRESDDLFLYSSKSKGSIEIGDFILDFNNRKELVGLELMNASRVLEDITGENVNKLLNNLKSCSVNIKSCGSLLIIQIHLISESKELNPVISFPSITKSPFLAFA